MIQGNQGYATWKRWERNAFAPRSPGAAYFLQRLQLRYNLRLEAACEVGFGNGEVLRILSEKCRRVVGIEQLDELVEAAGAILGVEAVLARPEFWKCRPPQGEGFDLVIGLSVLEHFDWEALHDFVQWLAAALTPGGAAVFQFPEGASPWSIGNYNGDVTHRTWITKGKLEHLIMGTGLELVAYDVDLVFSNRLSKSLGGRALVRLLDGLRAAYSEVLRIIAWPIARNILFRENTIAVLKQRARDDG